MQDKIASKLESLGIHIPEEFALEVEYFYQTHLSDKRQAIKAIYVWSNDLGKSHDYAISTNENLDETIPLFLNLNQIRLLDDITSGLFQDKSILRDKCLQCNSTSEINFNVGVEDRCAEFFFPFLVEEYLEYAFIS